MKLVTLQITVRVDDTVPANAVAQQIGDAIDPDAWNWDISYPAVVTSEPAPDDGEECDECGALIPDTETSMVNASHETSCSLHPGPASDD